MALGGPMSLARRGRRLGGMRYGRARASTQLFYELVNGYSAETSAFGHPHRAANASILLEVRPAFAAARMRPAQAPLTRSRGASRAYTGPTATQHVAALFHGHGRGVPWEELAATSGQVAAMLHLCSLAGAELTEVHSALGAVAARGVCWRARARWLGAAGGWGGGEGGRVGAITGTTPNRRWCVRGLAAPPYSSGD